jgi:hypothetical protein
MREPRYFLIVVLVEAAVGGANRRLCYWLLCPRILHFFRFPRIYWNFLGLRGILEIV